MNFWSFICSCQRPKCQIWELDHYYCTEISAYSREWAELEHQIMNDSLPRAQDIPYDREQTQEKHDYIHEVHEGQLDK